jgi:hypothetical protein
MKKLTDIIAHTSCVLGGGVIGGFLGCCFGNLQESELSKSTESIYEISECCGAVSEVFYSMISCSMIQPTLIGLGAIGGAAAGGLGYYFLMKDLDNNKK